MTTSARRLAETRSGKPLNLALWILQILLAAVFVRAGAGKLMSAPHMVALFDEIGSGHWLRYVTGSLEISGALLLVHPRTTFVGASILSCVMLGALATHVLVLHCSVQLPLFLLAVSMFIAWGRRDQLAPTFRVARRTARADR